MCIFTWQSFNHPESKETPEITSKSASGPLSEIALDNIQYSATRCIGVQINGPSSSSDSASLAHTPSSHKFQRRTRLRQRSILLKLQAARTWWEYRCACNFNCRSVRRAIYYTIDRRAARVIFHGSARARVLLLLFRSRDFDALWKPTTRWLCILVLLALKERLWCLLSKSGA